MAYQYQYPLLATPSSSARMLSPSPGPFQGSMSRKDSWASINSESAYPDIAGSQSLKSLAAMHMSPDPRQWCSDLSPDFKEKDDDLHNPSPEDAPPTLWETFSARGVSNVGCLALLILSLLSLFAGYPMASYFSRSKQSYLGGFNVGGINGTGQVPEMSGNRGLIDIDTPTSAYTKQSIEDGSEMQLVFSDEFNVDGRSFYPGDDPFWTAEDIHYWGTNNIEWYDPAALSTRNGSLEITLSAKETHNLSYQGGLMTTWNKFCFTGGYIETSVVLPGTNNIAGLWPAIWTMGNLGRAGYGATLDGMWPYTYDSCDVGTLKNQTLNGLPLAATTGGDKYKKGALSYLPGQRLSRCTCPGEDHPGPMHKDGSFVGRAAPEIDIFEAQVTGEPLTGGVSQSGQFAPFDTGYIWANTSDNEIIYDTSVSVQNTYIGGVLQQAASVVTNTNPQCYYENSQCYSVYGFEYKPGFDKAYISWVSDNKPAWTMRSEGVGPNSASEIGQRLIPVEPMYIIANLGMSKNFGDVDLAHLIFPTKMMVDYIRVYQRKDSVNVGCSPKEFPTAEYIAKHSEAYTNPNLTTWVDDYHQTNPKNSFLGEC